MTAYIMISQADQAAHHTLAYGKKTLLQVDLNVVIPWYSHPRPSLPETVSPTVQAYQASCPFVSPLSPATPTKILTRLHPHVPQRPSCLPAPEPTRTSRAAALLPDPPNHPSLPLPAPGAQTNPARPTPIEQSPERESLSRPSDRLRAHFRPRQSPTYRTRPPKKGDRRRSIKPTKPTKGEEMCHVRALPSDRIAPLV
jgi:hypothetical protein